MLETIFLILFVAILAWIVGRRSHLRLRLRLEMATGVLAILVVGAYVIAKRFEGGLGAVTHMSDQFPWGIWIGLDLCGIALAAGGFVLAASVHVLHLRRFEPILRPAVLTSFLAYQVVAAILVLDLGRPYRFWHPLLMWQPHSVMFEITLCLTLYTVVLVLEFSPVVFEHLRWHGPARWIHQLALPIVMLGVILSTLHQSSFGSLFLIVPQKLSRLWYTPMLPVLFFLSAVCAGMAVVIVESQLCAKFLHKALPRELVIALGRACSGVVGVYLVVKLGDLWWRGAWPELLRIPWLGASWLAEVVLGGVVPAVWLLRSSAATAPRWLVAAAGLVMSGVVLNRLNVCWFGLMPATGFVYWPSWMEWMLTLSLLLLAVIAFVALARFLPVFPEQASG